MWTTTQKNRAAIAFSALSAFNTHAAVDLDETVQPHRENLYFSNISGEHWSSNGIKGNQQSNTSVKSISDIVEYVKVNLGLPNKDIASIFGVTRQTLHSYRNQPQQHSVNPTTMERALLVSEVISEISNKLTRSPGAMAKNYVMEGESLLDLLKAENLDIQRILKLSSLLAEKMGSVEVNHDSPSNYDISLYQLTKVS